MKRTQQDAPKNSHPPSKHLKTIPHQSLFLPDTYISQNEHTQPHLYKQIRTLNGHKGAVTSARYSPNGLLLATSSSDCTIKLWCPKTGTLVSTLKGHEQGISSVAWSPDSKFVASASDDKTVCVWEVPTIVEKSRIKKVQRMLTEKVDKNQDLDFANELEQVKKQLGLLGGNCNIDLEKLLLSEIDDEIHEKISEDQDNTPYIFGQSKIRRILRGHTYHVTCVSYNNRGNLLVSGSSDESLRIWDIRGGKCLRTLAAHSDPVTSVEFSCDGTLVASGSQDGLIRLWDTRTGQCLKTLVAGFATRTSKHNDKGKKEERKGTEENPNAANAVMMIKFTPNSKYLLAGTLDAELRMWDYMSDKVVKTYRPQKLQLHHEKLKEEEKDELEGKNQETNGSNNLINNPAVTDTHKYSSLAIFIRDSQYGTLVARGTGESGDILFWNLQTREVVDVLDNQTANGHTDVVLGLDIHPDANAKEIVSASRDGTCKIWTQNS